jgi:hypothetical protein
VQGERGEKKKAIKRNEVNKQTNIHTYKTQNLTVPQM